MSTSSSRKQKTSSKGGGESLKRLLKIKINKNDYSKFIKLR